LNIANRIPDPHTLLFADPDSDLVFYTNEDPDPGANHKRFRILKLTEMSIQCGSNAKTLDVTIFYPDPDGEK
jgi:hypothetical protein